MDQTASFQRKFQELNVTINRHNNFLGKGKTVLEKVITQITGKVPLLTLITQTDATATFSMANIQIFARLEIPLNPGSENPGHLVPYEKVISEDGKSSLEKIESAKISIDELGNVDQRCTMDEGALLFLEKIMEYLNQKNPLVLY